MLYQLLVGKPPFEGSTPVVLMHSHLNEPPPRPSARIHEIPKVLDELVVNLMAKSPTDRPWDAAAVGMKLTELRDKVNRGASIAMVWPSQGAGAKSGRGGGQIGRRSRQPTAPSPATSPATHDSKKEDAQVADARGSGKRPHGLRRRLRRWLDRSTLETALLVAALVRHRRIHRVLALAAELPTTCFVRPRR